MYKVVRIERINDTVFRDDFKFDEREEAENVFTAESRKEHVVDVRLYYCIPYGGDKELVRFVRSAKE